MKSSASWDSRPRLVAAAATNVHRTAEPMMGKVARVIGAADADEDDEVVEEAAGQRTLPPVPDD